MPFLFFLRIVVIAHGRVCPSGASSWIWCDSLVQKTAYEHLGAHEDSKLAYEYTFPSEGLPDVIRELLPRTRLVGNFYDSCTYFPGLYQVDVRLDSPRRPDNRPGHGCGRFFRTHQSRVLSTDFPWRPLQLARDPAVNSIHGQTYC